MSLRPWILPIALLLLLPAGAALAKKQKKSEPAAPEVAYRADQQPGTPAQIAAGAGAWSICSGCHGVKGDGNVGLAPRLNSQTWLASASNDFIRTTIRDGRPGSNMVPWYEGLGDEALDALVAYIRSWQTEPGLELDESPLKGDPTTGRRLFVDLCAACHGVRGAGYAAGVDGVGIGRKAFLDNASNGFLRMMIRRGKSGTLMESFSEQATLPVDRLTDEDVDSLVQFLRGNAW